jgi:hypothetical protein
MVWKSTRRSVLALAASLAALGLGFKSKAATPPRGADPQSGSPLPAPAAAPFDTLDDGEPLLRPRARMASWCEW